MAHAARPLTLIAAAILIAASLPARTAAQGMFDSKPPKLPWKIAAVSDSNIYTMRADGTGRQMWKRLGNVTGRLTWSPDGKELAFARQGAVAYNLPDGGGGMRKIYDVFRSEIDSTRDGYWRWITFNHGARSPEWSHDGKKILYARDMNANLVDAELPDYQIEYCNLDGSEPFLLTRAGAEAGQCQGLDPTWSPDGKQIAFIYQKRKLKPGTGQPGAPMDAIGLVIVPATGITIPEEELEAQARRLPNLASPIWSPDGQWIACVNTQSNDAGIYLVPPDGGAPQKIVSKTERIIPLRGPVSWSPDSKWITFASADGFIFVVDSEGKQPPQRITSGGNDYLPAFSPK